MLDTAALAALNHLLNQADWARVRLEPFAGCHARLVMPPWQLDFRIAAAGYLTDLGGDSTATVPDVAMSLPADAPMRALQGQELIAAASVVGNAHLATELSFVLRNLRWDAEEDLSRLVGDIAAHRLVDGLQRLAHWQRATAHSLAENVAEYLTEERPVLVRAADLADFAESQQQFNRRLAAVEARVAALAARR